MYEASGGPEEASEDDGTELSLFKNTSGLKRFNPASSVASSSTSGLVVPTSASTSTNDNRLAYLAAASTQMSGLAASEAAVNSSGASSLIASQDEDGHIPLFTFGESDLQDSLTSLGAVGGLRLDQVASSTASGSKKVVNEDKNVVAVPKNIQRNIISRERDGRVQKMQRQKQPRNMQEPEDVEAAASKMAQDHDGFIPIKFRNDIKASNGTNNDITSDQSDMAEADQGRVEPGGQGRVEAGGLELDRVPTRLSSTELERRQLEEEDENLHNLVDEVLNSAEDVEDIDHMLVGSSKADQIPDPK